VIYLYLDVHGLIFETSVWLLAESTRLLLPQWHPSTPKKGTGRHSYHIPRTQNPLCQAKNATCRFTLGQAPGRPQIHQTEPHNCSTSVSVYLLLNTSLTNVDDRPNNQSHTGLDQVHRLFIITTTNIEVVKQTTHGGLAVRKHCQPKGHLWTSHNFSALINTHLDQLVPRPN
jgi:hypothetical protein